MTSSRQIWGEGDDRLGRLKAIWERVGESLFYIPSIFMLGAVILAQGMIFADRSLDAGDLYPLFESTVESSRVLLSVIAAGTITAASVVFSLTLVAVQLASTQFSPRTLGTFLGDRSQQMIIGLVLGTFVYCLLILRVVRGPLEEGGDSFVPRFSIMVAVILGVGAMVGVIASINRTAQSLRVASIARSVTDETMTAIVDQLGDGSITERPLQPAGINRGPARIPPDDSLDIAAIRSGWIQDVRVESLLNHAPEGSQVFIHWAVGSYVLQGQRLVSVWPEPDDCEQVTREIVGSFSIGERRSRHGDIGFGITRLVDIALRALSPGVNDPTTAEEIVLRLGEVMVELAIRDLPPVDAEFDGRQLIRAGEFSHGDYVDLAFEPIRRYAREDPRVLATIVTSLVNAKEAAKRRRPDAEVAQFDHEIEAVLTDANAMPDADRDLVLRSARAAGEHQE